MRRRFLGIIIAISLGFLAGAAAFRNSSSQKEVSLPRVSSAPARTEVNQTLFESAPKEDIIFVARVIDGDTIQLEDGERLRYIGMDTPESVDPRKPVQCFGLESASRNRELVEGKIVRLERDVSDKDRYGRLLRYVWLGNKMINLQLVEEGYATAFTYPPDVKYSKQFVAAESAARQAGVGLWKSCK